MSEAFDLAKAWAPYEALLPTSEASRMLERAIEYGGESPIEVIPSIHLTPEGPRIVSVVVVTPTLVVDVESDARFDFGSRLDVINLRWSIGRAEKAGSEGAPAREYQTATVEIMHSDHMKTTLNYVGTDLTTWASRVRAAFPLAFMSARFAAGLRDMHEARSRKTDSSSRVE